MYYNWYLVDIQNFDFCHVVLCPGTLAHDFQKIISAVHLAQCNSRFTENNH